VMPHRSTVAVALLLPCYGLPDYPLPDLDDIPRAAKVSQAGKIWLSASWHHRLAVIFCS
jgi:hypothetical protein